jgi:hypothetical protein
MCSLVCLLETNAEIHKPHVCLLKPGMSNKSRDVIVAENKDCRSAIDHGNLTHISEIFHFEVSK